MTLDGAGCLRCLSMDKLCLEAPTHIMDDQDDKADDENELPPEEDQRLPDFEETPDEESKIDEGANLWRIVQTCDEQSTI